MEQEREEEKEQRERSGLRPSIPVYFLGNIIIEMHKRIIALMAMRIKYRRAAVDRSISFS